MGKPSIATFVAAAASAFGGGMHGDFTHPDPNCVWAADVEIPGVTDEKVWNLRVALGPLFVVEHSIGNVVTVTMWR